jgi:hypothetical protein
MMTPEKFLKERYEIDVDKKTMYHSVFLPLVMREYAEYVELYKTMKESDEIIHDYRLKLLEEVKNGFDLCSDTSAFCLGYKNLVERIRREKENQPIDKSISPIKHLIIKRIGKK